MLQDVEEEVPVLDAVNSLHEESDALFVVGNETVGHVRPVLAVAWHWHREAKPETEDSLEVVQRYERAEDRSGPQ